MTRAALMPSRARIFAMVTAAVPGGVEEEMGTVARPFFSEADLARGAECGAVEVRALRIFPSRMDSSKSEEVRVGLGFFLEMRRDSESMETIWKVEPSFSATLADWEVSGGGGERLD